MIKCGVLALLTVGVIAVLPGTASALPGAKLTAAGTWCRTFLGKPHEHWGDSTGRGSRSEAYSRAVENWTAFVKLEYGRRYADFTLAQDKEVACKDDHGSWGCVIKARACRY